MQKLPNWHYTVPRGWMNDPNGLIYHNGIFHLYYQHHPYNNTWDRMHWGHATSRDLISWQTEPVALYPDENGTIFSGCVIYDEFNTSGLVYGGGLVAIYSYDNQSLGAAGSIDGGYTWEKHFANPIMPAQAKDFRDPRIIWDKDEGAWLMVIAVGAEIHFYSSRNLLDWQFLSAFQGAIPTVTAPDLYEVPDLIAFDCANGMRRYALVVSVNPLSPADETATRYFIGQWDGVQFIDEYPESRLLLDHGSDYYAGSCFLDSATNTPYRTDEGGVFFIGWANNWAYARHTPSDDWRGMMTSVRRMELTDTPDGWRIIQTPVTPRKPWRTDYQWEEINPEGDYSLTTTQRPYHLRLQLTLSDARKMTCRIGDGEHAYTLEYDAEQALLTCERPSANIEGINTRISTPIPMDRGALRSHLRLDIFVDGHLLEIFAQDGAVSITQQIYDVGDTTGDTLHLHIDGQAIRGLVELWRL